MRDLALMQEELQKFVLSETSLIHSAIVATEKVSVERRLNIYKEAYKARLIECLNSNFPALYAYLGTKEFASLANDYIAAYPSPYRSIRWYGDHLTGFVRKYYKEEYRYLAELVDLEWKMTLAFDAEDSPVLQMEEMAAVPADAWANLQFITHPSLQRLDFFWNTVPLWKTLVDDQDIPQMDESAEVVSWVLWRAQDYTTQFYSMSHEEAWALDAVIQGLSFGELCEGLCQWVAVEDVGMKAASFLKNWIIQGMLLQLQQ